MRDERTIANTDESEALTCEDYLIRLFPIFNTALFTGINVAGASLGAATVNELHDRHFAFISHRAANTTNDYLTPYISDGTTQIARSSAAVGSAIGFTLFSLLCAYCFFSRQTNPRDRLQETAHTTLRLACANIALSLPLPGLAAFFLFNSPLFDAYVIGISTGLGAFIIMAPFLIAALFFQLGKRCSATETGAMHEPANPLPSPS